MKNISCLLYNDWFLGLSLGIAAFIKVFVLFNQSEFLCSWDAYYYLIQVRAIIEEGSMHSSDYSLIYPYFTMLQLLIGDYILTYKIGNALLAALFAGILFFSLNSLCKNKAVVILLVLFTLISPVITYLIIQFPKNALGLIGLVFLVGALLRKNYKLGFIAILICLFSHRISLVLGVVFLLFMIVSRKMVLKIALILVCIALMVIIFPVIINIHDLERFKGIFGNSFQFAPFSFYRIINNGEANWFWLSYIISEVVLLLVSICFIIYGKHFKGRLNYYTALVFLAVVLLFPLYNMNFDGPAVRFYLSYAVFIPFWLVPLFTIVPLRLIWLCNFLLLLSFLGSIVLFDAKNYAPPYSDYHKITKNIQSYANPYKYKLIVAHKGLAEYFTFHTKMDALPWQPEPEVPLESILRITHKLELADFRRNLPPDSLIHIKKVGVQYYAMSESLYQQFVYYANFNKDFLSLDLIYCNDNPYRVRPKFVKRS